MPPAPLVCVVVPCFNAARWLPATLHSLQNQTWREWEAVFVNDGSTDDTAAVLAEICDHEPRVRTLEAAHSGVAHARNVGAKAASQTARFLFFLDADDALKPEALETLVAYLETHAFVGLVGCQFDEIGERGEFLRPGHRSRWVPGRFFPRELRPDEHATPFVTFFCGTGQGPFALHRREVWNRTDGWDETLTFAEDADMFCQMALLARVHYLPARLYCKRKHGAQSVTPANDALIQINYAKFRAKWDAYSPRDAREKRILASAKRYYRRQHHPFRDLKVGLRLIKEHQEIGRGLKLLGCALRDCFVMRS